MASLRAENDRLKNDNYTVCMRIFEANEENRQLRVSNMNIKNENDKLSLDLQRVSSCLLSYCFLLFGNACVILFFLQNSQSIAMLSEFKPIKATLFKVVEAIF